MVLTSSILVRKYAYLCSCLDLGGSGFTCLFAPLLLGTRLTAAATIGDFGFFSTAGTSFPASFHRHFL